MRRYQRTQSNEDKVVLKLLSARARFVKKQARKASWHQYVSSLNVNTAMSKIWDRVRKMRGVYKQYGTPILEHNGESISDDKDVAETLAVHYGSVSSSARYSPLFHHRRIRAERTILNFNNEHEHEYNAPFSYTEMNRMLKNCNNSAPGHDKVTYKMIVNSHKSAKEFLLAIYNKVWSEQSYPTAWKMGTVLSFLKPGKAEEVTLKR